MQRKIGLMGWCVFLNKLGKFLLVSVIQRSAFAFKVFACFHDRFRHAFVRFLGTTKKSECIGACNAFVAVFIIQTDSEQMAFGVVT